MLSGAAEMIGANVKEEGGRLVLSGSCDAGPYTVTLNQKDGTVLQVDFPDAGFTCDFDRFLKKSDEMRYHVAVCKGKDVDQPRNLAKSVTVE